MTTIHKSPVGFNDNWNKIILISSMSFWQFLPIACTIRDILWLCNIYEYRAYIVTTQVKTAKYIHDFFCLDTPLGFHYPSVIYASGGEAADILKSARNKYEVIKEYGASDWYEMVQRRGLYYETPTIYEGDTYDPETTEYKYDTVHHLPGDPGDTIRGYSYYELLKSFPKESFDKFNKIQNELHLLKLSNIDQTNKYEEEE